MPDFQTPEWIVPLTEEEDIESTDFLAGYAACSREDPDCEACQ